MISESKNLNIAVSLYIFFLLFVVNNLELYNTISQIQDINMRCSFELYQPHSNFDILLEGGLLFWY